MRHKAAPPPAAPEPTVDDLLGLADRIWDIWGEWNRRFPQYEASRMTGTSLFLEKLRPVIHGIESRAANMLVSKHRAERESGGAHAPG